MVSLISSWSNEISANQISGCVGSGFIKDLGCVRIRANQGPIRSRFCAQRLNASRWLRLRRQHIKKRAINPGKQPLITAPSFPQLTQQK